MVTLLNILLSSSLLQFVVSANPSDRKMIVDNLLQNYDKSLSPAEKVGHPTEVQLGVYVLHMRVLENNEYEMLLYLRQKWRDERLAFDSGLGESITVTEVQDRIWKPDIFMSTSSDVKTFDVPEPQSLLKVKYDGGVWYVRRLLLKGVCKTEAAQYFPMDRRICSIVFESFSYTMEHMYISWLPIWFDSPVELSDSSTSDADQWIRDDELLCDCTKNYTTGSFTCQEIQFLFHRAPAFYKLSVFVPSSILTILALLPLLIGSKQSLISKLLPALLAQLGLIMLSSEAYKNAPAKSTVTRMHVWMIFHHVFFLLILLIVILLTKLIRQSKQTETELQKSQSGGGIQERIRSKLNQYGWIIDMIIIILFIIIYIIFIIIYSSSAYPPDWEHKTIESEP